VNGQGRGLDRVLVRPLGTAALEVTSDRQAVSSSRADRRSGPLLEVRRSACVLWRVLDRHIGGEMSRVGG
jgi:hypothetical protein